LFSNFFSKHFAKERKLAIKRIHLQHAGFTKGMEAFNKKHVSLKGKKKQIFPATETRLSCTGTLAPLPGPLNGSLPHLFPASSCLSLALALERSLALACSRSRALSRSRLLSLSSSLSCPRRDFCSKLVSIQQHKMIGSSSRGILTMDVLSVLALLLGVVAVLIRPGCVVSQHVAAANLPPEQEFDRVLALPGQPPVQFEQYAGYITVDKVQENNLFYFFAESSSDQSGTQPLVLWLNGGR